MNLYQPIDHERAAALLDAHPDYRVLRALPLVEQFVCAKPQGRVRTAAVIDIETVGLELDHPIIRSSILLSSASRSTNWVKSSGSGVRGSGFRTRAFRSRPRLRG